MKQVWFANIAPFVLLAAAACSQQTQQAPITNDEDTDAVAEQGADDAVNVDAAELPPMITRSASYRCDDGDALYVDVLSDSSAVVVRDSRSDTPIRLERETDEGAFSGEGRTLSGTGSQISYSSPDRRSQNCREAGA